MERADAGLGEVRVLDRAKRVDVAGGLMFLCGVPLFERFGLTWSARVSPVGAALSCPGPGARRSGTVRPSIASTPSTTFSNAREETCSSNTLLSFSSWRSSIMKEERAFAMLPNYNGAVSFAARARLKSPSAKVCRALRHCSVRWLPALLSPPTCRQPTGERQGGRKWHNGNRIQQPQARLICVWQP